jgi:hypothetical protein
VTCLVQAILLELTILEVNDGRLVMGVLTLKEFDSKWSAKISSFIKITVNDEESDVFGFNYGANLQTEQNETTKEIHDRLESLTDSNEYYRSESLKMLSDEIYESNCDVSDRASIETYSYKSYGYDIKVELAKVQQADIQEFFKEFCEIDLNSFELDNKGIPESSYVRDAFTVTNIERLKDYIFYMLSFKNDCVEYNVMRNFLLMCYLLKRFSTGLATSNSSLTNLILKLDIDYSLLYLRISMLFPKSGTNV